MPIEIQGKTDVSTNTLIEKSVNLSAGGIGFVVKTAHSPGDVLSITLLLPDQVLFKASARILTLDPLPHREHTFRIHARFIGLTAQKRDSLIRYIMLFQRDELGEHYSA
ncbi:MAG: PilZ domain-containing protein [Nitrospirota bacterium]|nr:PilZ domain-containing protein [Nitrospirota bacterium]